MVPLGLASPSASAAPSSSPLRTQPKKSQPAFTKPSKRCWSNRRFSVAAFRPEHKIPRPIFGRRNPTTARRPSSVSKFNQEARLVPATPAAAATAARTAPSAAAAAALLRLVAIAAVHRPVATWLKRHRRLLAAAGTNHRRPSRFSPLVSASPAAACLLVLFCLPARFAALRRCVAALLEERLIFACECEFLTAVATGELQISSHGFSSFPLYVRFPHSPLPSSAFGALCRASNSRFFDVETASLRPLVSRSPLRNGRISLSE